MDDVANFKTHIPRHLVQDILVVMRHRANKMACVLIVIRIPDDIIFCKGCKAIKKQLVEIGLVNMFTYESGKTCQIPAWHGFMVYLLQDDLLIDM